MRSSVWLSLLALSAAALAVPAAGAGQAPRDVGLTEQVGRRLAQIDVTVSGPPEVVASLTREDFDLLVNSRRIDEFLLDQACAETDRGGPPPGELAPAADDPFGPRAARPQPGKPVAPVHYLFYFDQVHLTLEGRQRSLDLARVLIPKLIVDGSVGTLVSSGARLGTYADRSGDPEALLRAVDRLEGDRHQWSTYAEFEDKRIEDTYVAFEVDGAHAASVARRHQQEERWQTERALQRFAMVLGRMADVPPPKAAVYFADTMRSNAGEHYTYLLRAESGTSIDAMNTDSFSANNPFDGLLETAGSFGVRLYTIEARGLVDRSSLARGPRTGGTNSGAHVGSQPLPWRRRLADAQDSLVALARETGGQAFLNGAPSHRIADLILEELRCPLLISFDPSGLPEDRPLRVGLRVNRAGVEVHVRGQIVLPSASARRTARLMAAYAAPVDLPADRRVRGALIPTGFEEGTYSALVQLAVPATAIRGAVWDVGASLISEGRVREDAAGRIEIRGAGVPVVFETEMTLPPGEFEIAMVAHETRSNQIAAGHLDGALPDPRDAEVTVGPLAVLQPATGVFLRDGSTRLLGSLAKAALDPVLVDRPTAVVGLVCRSRPGKDRFEVRRILEGETAVEFPTLWLERQDDRCAQVRDVIPSRTMTSGGFAYELTVTAEETQVAADSIGFLAVDGDGFQLVGPDEEPPSLIE